MLPDMTIDRLGAPTRRSPLGFSTVPGDAIADYTRDDTHVLLDPSPRGATGPAFEVAGPRERIYFHGPDVVAGIVTCGGLCPGLNDVIRGLVMALWSRYGVRNILGFRYGYLGLVRGAEPAPSPLDPDAVRLIHHTGGSVLGSSRGHRSPADIVDGLVGHGVDVLFCVGGDGTMRGAQAIYEEVQRRGLIIAIVGLPKTIDNDLPYIYQSFGFDTAVSVAVQAIRAARVEASGAVNGVGLVRLMGRHAGFIAATASVASREADLVLIPELAFSIDGDGGLVAWLRARIASEGEAVIVVAEGAGQDHLTAEAGVDASGNPRLADIGIFLRDHLKAALADMGCNLKYIDPSYIIRAAPTSSADAIFCGRLADSAVHAAMAGKTGMVVGWWANEFTHVPLSAVNSTSKQIDPDGPLWRSVVDTTGQPATLTSTPR